MKLHEKKKVLSAHLNKELKKKLKKRSLLVKKGDTVKIMRGKFKGKEGKITSVEHKKGKVFVEKITRKKSDGTEVFIPLKASNLLLIEIVTDDLKRFKRKKIQIEEKKPAKETKKEAILNKRSRMLSIYQGVWAKSGGWGWRRYIIAYLVSTEVKMWQNQPLYR